MRTYLLPLLALCMLLGSARLASAQEGEPRAVIDRAIKAHGGEEQLSRFKARHNKVKGTIHVVDGIPYTQEIYYQYPAQLREVTALDFKGKKITVISVLNGDKGWIEKDGQTKEASAAELTEFKELAHLVQATHLVGLKDRKYQLSSVDEIKVAGRPAAGVKITTEGRRDLRLFFDAENGLLVKAERPVMEIQELVNEECFFGGWQEVNGVKVPTQIAIYRGGKKKLDSEAFEIKLVEKLDGAVFEKPE